MCEPVLFHQLLMSHFLFPLIPWICSLTDLSASTRLDPSFTFSLTHIHILTFNVSHFLNLQRSRITTLLYYLFPLYLFPANRRQGRCIHSQHHQELINYNTRLSDSDQDPESLIEGGGKPGVHTHEHQPKPKPQKKEHKTKQKRSKEREREW